MMPLCSPLRMCGVLLLALLAFAGVNVLLIYNQLAVAENGAVVDVVSSTVDRPVAILRRAATPAFHTDNAPAPSAEALARAAAPHRAALNVTAMSATRPLAAVEPLTLHGACAASFAVFAHLDLIGGDIGTAAATSDPTACCIACSLQASCDSWTWVANPERSEFHCYLKRLNAQSRVVALDRSRTSTPPLGRAKRLHFGRLVSGVAVHLDAASPHSTTVLDVLGVPRPVAPRAFDITGRRALIAAVTTVPSRLPHLHHAVQSICEQSLRADAVVVAVPRTSASGRTEDDYAATLPPKLEALRRGGCPIIVVRGDDFGPATKLIPALQFARHADDCVVTFDDDNWYSPELLASLVAYEAVHPNAVLAHSGYRVLGAPYRHPHFEYIRGSTLRAAAVPTPITVHIAAGFLGVLYKRRFFGGADATVPTPLRAYDAGVRDVSDDAARATARLVHGLLAPTEARDDAEFYPEGRFVDDDYISGVLSRRGVTRFVVPFDIADVWYEQVPASSTEANALSSGANKGANIDRQERLLSRFVREGCFSRHGLST